MDRSNNIMFLLLFFRFDYDLFASDKMLNSNNEDLAYSLKIDELQQNNKKGNRIYQGKTLVLSQKSSPIDERFCLIKDGIFHSSYKKADIIELLNSSEIDKEKYEAQYRVTCSYKVDNANYWKTLVNVRSNQPFFIRSNFSTVAKLQDVYEYKFIFNRQGIFPQVSIYYYNQLSEKYSWRYITLQNFVRLCSFILLIAGCSYKLTRWYIINNIKAGTLKV